MNESTQRIKELVQQSGKTYQELEEITGIKKSSLQRYASGVTAKIPMDVVEKLESAFNVHKGYIMGCYDQSLDQILGHSDAVELARNYIDMSKADQNAIRDYMTLSDADRYALQLIIASLKSKK